MKEKTAGLEGKRGDAEERGDGRAHRGADAGEERLPIKDLN